VINVVVCGLLLAIVSHKIFLGQDFSMRYLERLYHCHLIFGLSRSPQTFGIQFIIYDFTLSFRFSAFASGFGSTERLSILTFGTGGLCEHFF